MVAEFKGDCNFEGASTTGNYGTVNEFAFPPFSFPFPFPFLFPFLSFLVLPLPMLAVL